MKGWGENFFEKEEGTETSSISAFPFVLRAFIFNLCAYVPQSQAQPSIIYEFCFTTKKKKKKYKKSQS